MSMPRASARRRQWAAAEAGLAIDAHDVLLVVEIASPSTRVTDRTMKPSLYAAAGIAHYWRLDLEPAPCLYLGTRAGVGYEERVVQAGRSADLAAPFQITLDPGHLTR
ncbi:Uma2 family endonuclease [Streptomyces sp. NPDC096176]|uniref:Uma2 family endonuclease n=1 Tax=Streptomyces sp. NPDC096176 TaxID=3366079 RepID=UPI00381C4CE6